MRSLAKEVVIDEMSGLVLARPDRKFVLSYVEALQEGMGPARHKSREEEIHALLSGNENVWAMFSETIVNARDTDNHCLEDLFWLTKSDLFIGYICLRNNLGPQRKLYGGNTGRELRPSERNKGYGTTALRLTKNLAAARGFTFLEMVTAFDNIAAIRPWEKCGAEFIERFENPPKSYYPGAAVKYRITL